MHLLNRTIMATRMVCTVIIVETLLFNVNILKLVVSNFCLHYNKYIVFKDLHKEKLFANPGSTATTLKTASTLSAYHLSQP